MNICIALDSFITGGTERVAVTLSNEFILKGHNVNILLTSSNDAYSPYNLDSKVAVYSAIERNKNGFFSRCKRIRKIIMSTKPDVVIGFLPHVCIYLWHSLRRTKIKFIVSERNDPSQMRKIYKILLKHIFRKADGTVFQNNDSLKWYFKKPHKLTTIILNPVYLNEERYCVQKKTNNIIYVGRLLEQKNVPMLLNSYKKFAEIYNNTTLKIYGEGNLRSELVEQCKMLDIYDKVLFCGNDVNWQKKEIDARMFVLPSKREGMPNALEEALCLGIPSVSTDCPSGGARILMEMFGVENLLSKINNDDLCAKMIDCYSGPFLDKKVVEENRLKLSKENITNKWLDFIEKVIKQ